MEVVPSSIIFAPSSFTGTSDDLAAAAWRTDSALTSYSCEVNKSVEEEEEAEAEARKSFDRLGENDADDKDAAGGEDDDDDDAAEAMEKEEGPPEAETARGTAVNW